MDLGYTGSMTKNPLVGVVPEDGDVIELTLEELAAIDPKAAAQARKEHFGCYWAQLAMDPEDPSLVIDGNKWDIMAAEGDVEDAEAPHQWCQGEWQDVSRW